MPCTVTRLTRGSGWQRGANLTQLTGHLCVLEAWRAGDLWPTCMRRGTAPATLSHLLSLTRWHTDWYASA